MRECHSFTKKAIKKIEQYSNLHQLEKKRNKKKENENNKKKKSSLIIMIVIGAFCICLIGVTIVKYNFFKANSANSEKNQTIESNEKNHNIKLNEKIDNSNNQNEESENNDNNNDNTYNKDEILEIQELVSSPMLSQNYNINNMSLSEKVFMIMSSLSADIENNENTPKTISTDGEVDAILCDGAYSEKIILETLEKVYSDSNISLDELDGIKIYATQDKYYSGFLIYDKTNKVFSYYDKPLDSPKTCSVKNRKSRNEVESIEQNGNEVSVISKCSHCEGSHRKYTFKNNNGKYYFKSVEIIK